ncbi:hypothetical protein U91I_04099 [alpha proteobacterium U9-1i]|nr:hypothetical protein U91I_04099 [alpha proteobacterium U9-1i]
MLMQKFLISALVVALSTFATPAAAEVVNASPGSFMLRAEEIVNAEPDRVWRALSRVQNWWNAAHTYSGDSSNLRLAARAGGCFCETWGAGQSVEHARVVMVSDLEGVRTLRLLGALGPLQDMGVSGVLTFSVAEDAAGAKVTMTYRIAGDPALGLDSLAPLVDGVLNEQFGRLVRYSRGEGLN